MYLGAQNGKKSRAIWHTYLSDVGCTWGLRTARRVEQYGTHISVLLGDCCILCVECVAVRTIPFGNLVPRPQPSSLLLAVQYWECWNVWWGPGNRDISCSENNFHLPCENYPTFPYCKRQKAVLGPGNEVTGDASFPRNDSLNSFLRQTSKKLI